MINAFLFRLSLVQSSRSFLGALINNGLPVNAMGETSKGLKKGNSCGLFALSASPHPTHLISRMPLLQETFIRSRG